MRRSLSRVEGFIPYRPVLVHREVAGDKPQPYAQHLRNAALNRRLRVLEHRC